ncbi:ABC transporter ATP-binding protein [Enterovibrio nigricans]|uniref:Peptide/nickel transport system ATP-binding protein n=1 Tax=Enterovibrio nigricans DSM 22720 TaxID=1121868 RepID=A0A1T4V7M8_9GAMM|nr:ATP-binding cassette domain-containing protein [Enterovibrio nigricans]PKF50252.1 ABC transporter ATP-binding protein [Enterovibrio nigricans]SKA60988.1 peptide/nickel transport system ATP-binding protein [Enterovibrio nigricans DSM 22720]
MNSPIIQVQDISKTFSMGGGFAKKGSFHALRGVSFDLHKGRTLALVGESGCGKSTVARLITKVHDVTSGNILFNGQNIKEIKTGNALREYRGQVQMVFQDPFGSLNPAHRIDHHIARPLGIYHARLSDAEIREKQRELLSLVELDADCLNKFPHQLSGGQRQRVNLARALGVGAQVILADEPTSMLDVSIRLGVLNLMQRMKQEMGIGFLYITHDLATAHYIAEDTAVMYRGQIVEWGDTQQILSNPQHPYTKLLISAVPDPDLPFADLIKETANYAENAEGIRALSERLQPVINQVSENHFVRCWESAA